MAQLKLPVYEIGQFVITTIAIHDLTHYIVGKIIGASRKYQINDYVITSWYYTIQYDLYEPKIILVPENSIIQTLY